MMKTMDKLEANAAASNVASMADAIFWVSRYEAEDAYDRLEQRLHEQYARLKAVMEPQPTAEDYRRWRRLEPGSAAAGEE